MATYPDSLLILNGKSAGNDLLRQAIQGLRDDGARIHVRVTWEKGDAARYINEALGLGVETIIWRRRWHHHRDRVSADRPAPGRPPGDGIYRSAPPMILPPAPGSPRR